MTSPIQLEESDFVIPEIKPKYEYSIHPSGSDQVTVKFYTADSKVFTKSYPQWYQISKVKSNFVELFTIPYGCIVLLYKDEVIQDETKLEKFKKDKFGILELRLLSNDPEHKIHIENAYKDLIVPDILTVQVQTEDEGIKEVVVEIENKAIEKPFIGGYRHIQTGVQYFHGFTQTGPPKPKVPPERKNHRDTQTYDVRNRKTEQDYAHATQMTDKTCCIPNVTDKILTPRPYETAEEREKRLDVIGKIRTIQRYYRAWKMRKCLKALSEDYRRRVQEEIVRDQNYRLEEEELKRNSMISRAFPLTSDDFAMLYAMVDRWKRSEIKRIAMHFCGPAKIAEFSLLLDKEIQLLQSIESIKQKLRKDIETKKIVNFFRTIGNPIEWDHPCKNPTVTPAGYPIEWENEYRNLHISMDTLETQKGREFFMLYKNVAKKHQSNEEKIQSLADLRAYLSTHTCNERHHILKLVDRAAELLARGSMDNHLEMLQSRIEYLLIQHFLLVHCNEGVTNHMTIMKVREMEESLVQCKRCQKLKTLAQFALDSRNNQTLLCKSCKRLDTIHEPGVDILPYKFLLDQIRKHERLHKSQTSIAFILQPTDLHYIVVNIWHGHSVLSECKDIYSLRVCRWNRQEEWSPWNCVVMTLQEVMNHNRVENLEDVYEKELMDHVFNKHALAKLHFSQLHDLDVNFRKKTKDDPKLQEAFWEKKPPEQCLELD